MEKSIKCLDKGFVRLIDHMGDDSAVVQMARVSYGSGTKSVNEDRGLIRYLLRNKHTSPFEGVQFKFHVKLPIFISNQWVRHRTWSFNQMSARYSVMPEDCYVPFESDVTTQDPKNKQGGTNTQIPYTESEETLFKKSNSWAEAFAIEQSDIKNNYNNYLKCGMRRELARINLPMSQYTEMYASVDLHNLLHFLKLRLDSHAQYEIRVYAQAIYDIIQPIVPLTCEAFDEYTLNNLTLNKKDVEGLQDLLRTFLEESFVESWVRDEIENISISKFDNKRERLEFISKINKLIEPIDFYINSIKKQTKDASNED